MNLLLALLITQGSGPDDFAGYRYTFLTGTEPSGLRYVVKPALVELGNGDLLLGYTASAHGDTLNHNTYLRRSTNRGAEWSTPTFFFNYGIMPDGSDAIDKGTGLSVVATTTGQQVVWTQTVKHGGPNGTGFGPGGERRSMPFRESFDYGYTWSATTTPIRTAEWASSGGESQIRIVGNECWHVYYDQERGDACEAIMLAKAQRESDGSCPLDTAILGAVNAWSAEIVFRVCFELNHNGGWRVEEPTLLEDPYDRLDDRVIIFRNSHFRDGAQFVDGNCYAVTLPKDTLGARWSSQPTSGPIAVPNTWLPSSSPVGRRPAEFNFDDCTDAAPREADSVAAPTACRARRLFPCSTAPKGIVTASGLIVIAAGDSSLGGRGVLRASWDFETWMPALEYQDPTQRAQQGVAFMQPFPGVFSLVSVQEVGPTMNTNTRFEVMTLSPSELVE